MNNIFSFYKLINNYKIEIPMIQRDYAQGRNNPKAKDVRKSIVTSVINALNSPEKKDELFFDFVYGKVDGDVFIPFDGQQRLTTLFLIHLYVFEKCQKEKSCTHHENCYCDIILNKFSYKTRQSSREFCEQIVKNNIIVEKNSISENIKNQPWFFADWEKDPTIVGMLAMLDEIDTQFKDKIEFQKYAERLTSGCNCPITFHFVDMKEYKLTDTTYIKMNARGKSLTPFENFKASLEQYLESIKQKDLLERFKGKYDEKTKKYTGIDGIWLDLFWKEQKGLPDNLMLSFFNRHFRNVWNNYFSNLADQEKQKEKHLNDKIDTKEFSYPTKDIFISFKDVYEPLFEKCNVKICLTPIFNLLDNLVANNDDIKKNSNSVWARAKINWDLFVGTISNNDETYASKTAFYALLQYYNTPNNKTDKLSDWMRVVWNIVENYVEGQDSYMSAVKMINDLSVNSITILSHLSERNNDFPVAKEQMEEEIFKAKLICTDNAWETKIIEAEKFVFFKGAIRFLFRDADGNYTKNDFDTKFENCKKYFDENGVKDSDDFKYRTDAILLKATISRCPDFWKYVWWEKYIFDNKATTWKNNLLVKNDWQNPIHHILNGNLSVIISESTNILFRNLYETNLLNYVAEKMEGSRLRDIHGYRAIYQPRYQGIMFYDNRNSVLSKLIKNKAISSDQKIEGCDFFWGWNIDFKYKDKTFQWNTNNKVYLLENGQRKKDDNNEAICFDTKDITAENYDELISWFSSKATN